VGYKLDVPVTRVAIDKGGDDTTVQRTRYSFDPHPSGDAGSAYCG